MIKVRLPDVAESIKVKTHQSKGTRLMTNHDNDDTILDGLEAVHNTLAGTKMDDETFEAAAEASIDKEDIIEVNWEPYCPPEEWDENFELYLEYKDDPLTDEARWRNMGSAAITLELIRWIASASTGDKKIARDISIAVPKVDIAKAMYFDGKGTREQLVLLRDGIAVRSAAVCRYLTLGNKRKRGVTRKSTYIDIATERASITNHINRFISTSKLGKGLNSSLVDTLSKIADSLWYSAETERALTMLSPHILIGAQATYASDSHARLKHNILIQSELIDSDGNVVKSSKPDPGNPIAIAMTKLITNKLYRLESHMRDIIANVVRPSFPISNIDQAVKATIKYNEKLENFILASGKSTSHVEKFMDYFENVLSEVDLETDDIEEYAEAMQEAQEALADKFANSMGSQIEKMMRNGASPSSSSIRGAASSAAEKATGGIDDWDSETEDSEAATRITCSGDKDGDEAEAIAQDAKDNEKGRNPAGAGSMDSMSHRTEGLQNEFEWGGPDLSIKSNHNDTELMLIPKISAPGVAGAIDTYKQLVSEHSSYIRSTMRYISAILDDETGMFVKDHQKRGKIDPNRLNQYWRTDEIFRTFEHISGDRNYAISLVVDGSGSMSGDPIKMATAGAVIIAEALDDLEIPFSVMVYNTGYVSRINEEDMDVYEISSDPTTPYVCTPAPPNTFSGGGIVNTLYKPFSDGRMTIADKCKLGYMVINGAGGCNDDAYAIRFATNALHQYRDRDNKIMIVIADGYPAGHAGGMIINDEQYDQDEALKKMIEIAMKTGIQVVGLGIEGCDISEYYPVSQDITSLSDIPRILGELLKESIRTGRRQS